MQSAKEGVHFVINTQTNTVYLHGVIHSCLGLNNYQNKNIAKLVQLADPSSTKTYTKDGGKLVIAHIIPARMRILGDVSTEKGICIFVPE